jgi:hypothetical protein
MLTETHLRTPFSYADRNRLLPGVSCHVRLLYTMTLFVLIRTRVMTVTVTATRIPPSPSTPCSGTAHGVPPWCDAHKEINFFII